MAVIQYGVKVVLGVPEKILLIQPSPKGIVRLRFRNYRAACAFVKNGNVIEQHFLQDCGDHWELMPASAKNVSLRRRGRHPFMGMSYLDCVGTYGCKATVQTIQR